MQSVLLLLAGKSYFVLYKCLSVDFFPSVTTQLHIVCIEGMNCIRLKHFISDPNSVKLENYPIHTITGILKQWLRELPDPLMTSAQYNDFLRAVGRL